MVNMDDHRTASGMAPGPHRRLPWRPGVTPLMLAPMQGLTNRSMRSLFIDWVRPDVVFTEFLRVSNVSRKRLTRNDLTEAGSTTGCVPLVAQLVGNNSQALVAATRHAEAAGAEHINLNLGCPYGRMTTGATGGALLQDPGLLAEILPALRQAVSGTFSVKLRLGYEDPGQIFSLLPLLEASRVDFLVLHPRTVVQKYAGVADHSITAQVVAETSIPLIANGDIRTAEQGRRILEGTGAAGLMLGRSAIADPLLFTRLRMPGQAEPDLVETVEMFRHYMHGITQGYRELFCGEAQTLDRIKNILTFIDQPGLARLVRRLKKTRDLKTFARLVEEFEPTAAGGTVDPVTAPRR